MAETAGLRVGVIGLGAMGARIATRLVRESFNPQVYDVVDVAVRLFTNDVGGMLSGSPKMMAQSSDIIITVLATTDALREVLFGWQPVADGFASGGIVIDMGGTDAAAAIELSDRLAQRGIHFIDAPALGTPADARVGQLTFTIGGDEAVVARCQPIFAVLAARTLYAGPVGTGLAGSALGDYLRSVQLLAAAEALRIGAAFGLPLEAIVQIGETLGGVSPAIAGLLRRQVLTRTFETGLALGHVRKGIEASSEMARARGMYAPLLAASRDAWNAAENVIGSGADQSEVLRWLESVAAPQPDNATGDSATV